MSGETKTFSLNLVTWNVGDEEPSADLTDLLNLKADSLPDIYAIGLQELVSGEFDAYKNSWTTILTDTLGPKGFCRIKAVKMQGILLVTFVKREYLLSVAHIESEISRAGMGGWWGNKGGVSIRFDLNGVNMIIVNSHLAAHMHNSAERIEDFFTILDTQHFRDKDVEHILDHDYVFWMGDLNFRIDKYSREEVEKYIEKKDFETLLKQDQLMKCREEGLIFCDFEEGKVDFPPTYKFDKGTDDYDNSAKKRVPAWCDRILWQIHDDAFEKITISADLVEYKSIPSYVMSDHKPVTATFNIKVFPCQRYPASVTFDIDKCWKAGKSATLRYKMKKDSEIMSSNRDWIGLYKSNFFHLNDYVTYAWAQEYAEKSPEGVEVTLSGRYLSVCPGNYRVGYISTYKDTLMGMSEEFQIVS
ncbi:inositol polyphosphate 5-phosphatase K-like isoform X2 [Ostrea edulis]|uniref:inositol polyphosphate 5-phosphatase K-like isoform X2 n=1 Tax=Ostrea edulis TaxID=37623 RepID=UPI0020945942|nr:inositol polyphosphate 5-phosphatase K-like isoform X2 [Ostrea edulis]